MGYTNYWKQKTDIPHSKWKKRKKSKKNTNEYVNQLLVILLTIVLVKII